MNDVHFGNLFYADVAKRSYADFAALKLEGKIAPDLKFQIDLVPAHSVIWLFLQDDLHQPLDPVFNAALKREIDKIAETLPHDQIAIQFDVASAVFARLQRGEPNAYGNNRAQMLARFSRILTDLAEHGKRPAVRWTRPSPVPCRPKSSNHSPACSGRSENFACCVFKLAAVSARVEIGLCR